jgi:hypothetical protein
MQTIHLPDTHTTDQLMAIRIMLEVAHASVRRMADVAALYAHQQRQRAERCQQLTERLRTLEESSETQP